VAVIQVPKIIHIHVINTNFNSNDTSVRLITVQALQNQPPDILIILGTTYLYYVFCGE
jgi:hypothetical protein